MNSAACAALYTRIIDPELTEVQITNLDDGIYYKVAIYVTNEAGFKSSVSDAEVSKSIGQPTAPTEAHLASGDAAVIVSWGAPLSDGGANILDYGLAPFNVSANTYEPLETCQYNLRSSDGRCLMKVVAKPNSIIEYIAVSSKIQVKLKTNIPFPHTVFTGARVTVSGSSVSNLINEFVISNVTDQSTFDVAQVTPVTLAPGQYTGGIMTLKSFSVKYEGVENNKMYGFQIFAITPYYDGITWTNNESTNVVPLSSNSKLKYLRVRNSNDTDGTTLDLFRNNIATPFSPSTNDYTVRLAASVCLLL